MAWCEKNKLMTEKKRNVLDPLEHALHGRTGGLWHVDEQQGRVVGRGAPPQGALGNVFAGKKKGVSPSSLRQTIVGADAHTSAAVTF